MKKLKRLITLLLITSCLVSCGNTYNSDYDPLNTGHNCLVGEVNEITESEVFTYVKENSIKVYTDKAYIEINNNKPYFDESDKTISEFEFYSELDELGRCGEAYANICLNLIPTEERGEIGHIKPSGWQSVKYPGVVDGNYLYNRCHLIGFQLAGENDNEKNLITGTRFLNIEGMLPFENMIADYVENTGNHVLYRVTPIYNSDELVARGVLMEAYSLEDNGQGIEFCIFAYNIQPGVDIDYKTGKSKLTGVNIENTDDTFGEYTENEYGITYVVNVESKKFHLESCRYVKSMSDENKELFNGTVKWLLDNEYEPCGICEPDTIHFTDEELNDMQYVDDKIQAVTNEENYSVYDIDKVLKQLESEGKIGEIEFNKESSMYYFKYNTGLIGGVHLNELDFYTN